MTAPAPTRCGTCLGDQVVVVEQRGTDVPIPCVDCCCAVCGQPTDTPPECLSCAVADDDAFRRRNR